MQEEWKPVTGFDGYYEVSNFGRVKTCKHSFVRKDGKPMTIPERIINGSVDTKGYLQVDLKIDGKRYIRCIHRLVADAFIENPEKKDQVNHKDGNKLNNSVDNLEWVTCKENIRHAWGNHLNGPLKGEKHGNHILTDDAVRYIRENYKPRDKKNGMNALARKFGVSTYPIYRVLKGEGWKHIQ